MKGKKIVSAVLVLSMVLAFAPVNIQAAAKPKISNKKVTIAVKGKKKVTIKNVKKVTGLKWTSKSKKIAKPRLFTAQP